MDASSLHKAIPLLARVESLRDHLADIRKPYPASVISTSLAHSRKAGNGDVDDCMKDPGYAEMCNAANQRLAELVAARLAELEREFERL